MKTTWNRSGRCILGEENQTCKNVGLLLFRVLIGIFMLTHGWQKVMNFDTLQYTFADPIGLGSKWSLIMIIMAEVGCSILVILGLFTRLAVLPLIFGLFIATFVAHAGDGFSEKESSLFYMSMFAVLFLIGPGRYSIDQWLRKKYLPK